MLLSPASVNIVPPANILVLGRPLDPVLDLRGQRGRAGPLGANADGSGPTAAQICCSGSLLPPSAASIKATDVPSVSAVPALAAGQ